MRKLPKKIVQFQDPILTVGGTVFVIVCILLCFFMYSFINPYAEDAVIGRIWCIIMVSLLFLCPVLCAKQWYTTIVLDEHYIRVNIPFQKPLQRRYESYPFIYKVQYQHGSFFGLGFARRFIVLSNSRLEPQMLHQANQIRSGYAQIKIPLNRRNVSFLVSALPSKQKEVLKHLVEK